MRIGLAALAVACLLIFAARGTGAEGETELIAVLDLQSVGARDPVTSALTDRLREELLKSKRFVLVDRSQMETVLSEQALQQSGCTEQECAVEVGRLLGVRKLVIGKVTKISETLWQVSGIMVDVQTSETLRAESVQHKGDLMLLLTTGIADLAQKLAGPPGSAPQVPAASPAAAAIAPRPEPYGPGEVWREPLTGMELIYVPGGEYEQGCVVRESECDEWEKPAHRVTVRPFWIGKTEVTQGQWKTIMGKNPSDNRKGDDFPVEDVEWNQVRVFLSRMYDRDRRNRLRLPTETEWEYACRAGGQPIAYGTSTGELDEKLARYGKGNRTVRVANYPPNALGLYDLSGNVAEWVSNFPNPYGRSGWGVGKESKLRAYRVIRGGGHDSPESDLRCSHRRWTGPSSNRDWIGFRLARTPPYVRR